jgi:hypothetical protein
MPLKEYTHDEPGEMWYVETPNREFSGKREGVTFIDGVGQTADIWTARLFDQYYGYDVIGYTGSERWGEQIEPSAATGKELPEHKNRTAFKSMADAIANLPKGQFEVPKNPPRTRKPNEPVPA